MSDVIIRAENIGKCYTLNHQASGGGYQRFSDTLLQAAKAPLRWLAGKPGQGENASSQEEFWALKDVSFEIKRGEVVGIIGRNGAGKSTLLKVLSRITEPTRGRITLEGRVASLLEVGTGFHPELTGRENIFLNGAILGMRREEIKAKFDEIVAFAEIEKFLDTPVKRYSSGMYVRLAFAVAAHLEPEILIVDEVLAVGDAEFQKKCLGKMQDVAGNGRTVLFVSHSMEAIDRLTNRCLFLNKGNLRLDGLTKDVVSCYLQQANIGDKDISRFRSSSKSGTLKFVGIWTESLNGSKSAAFRQGEPFRIVLEVDAECELLSDFAVVIENSQQHALFTTHLTDLGSAAAFSGKKKLVAEFSEPMLRRGNYTVSVAAFSTNQQTFYDVVLHYPLIEVAGTIGTEFPDDSRWGDLFIPITWRVEQ